MRITVDTERCDSHGNCFMEAPEVFDLDDEDKVVLLDDDPREELRGAVDRAIAACPVSAIRLLE
jgi:ferredoxin